MTRRRKPPLVYGVDPMAVSEGEDIAMVVLDLETARLLGQIRAAKTWGEAFAGFDEGLDKENQKRWESERPPRLPNEPFDLVEESTPEAGIVYRLLVETESTAANAISGVPQDQLKPLLDQHIRFESGMVDCFRCYLKSDESAFLVWDLLRGPKRREVQLTRDDALVSSIRTLG